jgi:mannose-6-phosphate isomerase-like protein (cupin superfamily)
MKPENSTNPLRMPGATLLTRLSVYDTESPDGQPGGTPHFHLVCSELYFALSGSGAVEIIDINGFQRIPLAEHSAFLFSPGTLHRLVNPNRNLEILLIMENSGLPERGDTIGTFSTEILSNDLSYHQAMQASSLQDAYRRRDDAVRGFLAVKDAFDRSLNEGRALLQKVYELARARTAGHQKEWYEVVTHGAFDEAQSALMDIVRLQNGKIDHLYAAQNHYIAPVDANTVGFCGRLNRYFDPGTLLPEGVKI